mmetsp:Transcript_31567/g.84326  ORF Transcript_31567/g.84326 Transcript_31567/m.84326 type:complete len:338 (-) Transcript_31567:222-1235(-)
MVADTRTMLGRVAGDHERLFPHKTVASAATRSEVTVNGHVVRIWDYAQLETLSAAVLQQRMLAIRDAVGQDKCAPWPSKQVPDMIRWILHMQTEITQENVAVGRQGSGIPPWLKQENERRPISNPQGQNTPRVPFGPRSADTTVIDAARDHYNDMLERRAEFAEVQNMGIQTMRIGGEGRRHIAHGNNMDYSGVSKSSPVGIQTMKESGEGRRYHGCTDHLAMQALEMEAINRGEFTEEAPLRVVETDTFAGHAMRELLGPGSQEDERLFFDRKKHIDTQDHMLNNGTADSIHWDKPARKNQEAFSGPASGLKGTDRNYQSNWRQDPSRLQGTSLLV